MGVHHGKGPGILVAHEAPGLTEHVKERACLLAVRGYVAFALDLYGSCLGGVVALELARDETPIRCAVGFRAGLMGPRESSTGRLSAKILMMIGDEDPIVTTDDRESFVREMKGAGADWQLHVFGGVGHSYTNREIDALAYPGFRYDARADRRA